MTRIHRIEGIARLVPRLAHPATRAEAAAVACSALCELTGCDAAAVFLNDGVLSLVAHSGFALLPPEGLPASLDEPELAALTSWATRAGLAPVELAFLRFENQILGVLGLFGGHVEPLGTDGLDLLGSVVACALEQARTVDELRRAYETQERTQDQMMRTERLRVLGEMALGIAHDFNNVLNAVLGQVGVLELLTDGDQRVQGPIERLKHVALDGANTIGRLQDFSRQRRDQEFAEVDFSSLVSGAVAGWRERRYAAVTLDVTVAPGVHVAGTSGDLREVLESVLANAVEARASRVRLRLETAGEEAQLTVSDNGCGMTREVRKKAFDPFFTTKGSLVSGLGLSVAYGIVRRHGGRIDLDSAHNRGCEVVIRLPAIHVAGHAGPPTGTTRPGAPSQAAGLAHILLVEDDADNREAMATLLGLGGYFVTAADSGNEGIRRFSTGRFDLVLTDLGLPDMTGWEVARQVKEAAPATPVALITGWGLNLALDEIRRRGVDLLIKKPIEPRRFLEQLAHLGLGASNQPARP